MVLLRIDDDTLNGNPPDAAVFPQDPSAPRLVIQAGMKAGNTAAIPNQINSLVTAIRSDAVQRNMIVIAVLLDQHNTSWAAISAGWEAFINTAPVAVGSHLAQLQDPAHRGRSGRPRTYQSRDRDPARCKRRHRQRLRVERPPQLGVRTRAELAAAVSSHAAI